MSQVQKYIFDMLMNHHNQKINSNQNPNIELHNIFQWLYCPTNNISINKIFDCGIKNNIPYDILIMKYIQLLCFNGLDSETIIQTLLSQLNVLTNIEVIEHIRKEEQHTDMCDLNFFDKYSIPKTIQQENQKIIKKSATDEIHSKYPLINPSRGRPHLEWLVCYHENCMKFCSSTSHLTHHLKEHGCFTHHFHRKHELAIEKFGLTPEKILLNNITCCPSPICDTEIFNSPEELIKHLTLLGIEPFWQKGIDVRNLYNDETTQNLEQKQTNKYKQYKQYTLVKPVFRSEECVCCVASKPQIVFFPCKHSNLCIKCYKLLDKKVCPECRKDITKYLPY